MEQKEPLKDFAKLFIDESVMYKKRIAELSIRLRNIREIPEVQVELLSDRQKVLEYSHRLGQTFAKLNMEYKKMKRDRLIYWSDTHVGNYRYGATEKTVLIDGDLADMKNRMDVVDEHISNINETIKTIDHALYGIKSRIQLEEFLRVSSVK